MSKLKRAAGETYATVHDAFPYQIEALQTLKDLEYGAIFHEQGLGKTKIAIDLGLHWLTEGVVDSVIFVTKKALSTNWDREIRAHTSLKPRIITSDRNKNFNQFNSPSRFYIAHYEAIRVERERIKLFSKTRDLGIVLDEAHKIKNPESGLFEVFAELSSCFLRRVVMTGTPVANRPYDVWAPIFFLDHGISLGTDFANFKQDFDFSEELPDNQAQQGIFADNLESLFGCIGHFAVRETKDGAGIDLPQKTFRTQECEWEPIQQEIYRSYMEEARHILLRDGKLIEDSAESILKKLLRLVQVASNPRIIDRNYHQLPGKFTELETLLSANRDRGEKSIVWSSFTDNVDWLRERLQDFGAVKIHGKMDLEARYRSVDRLMGSDDCWVLVASPGAAKEGLTLTAANHVVFYDRGFSLDDYLQAQDRIHRISQERECFVTKLVLPGSIDEWVDELLIAKELAAKLSLRDITRSEFVDAIDFSFFSSLSDFLHGATAQGEANT